MQPKKKKRLFVTRGRERDKQNSGGKDQKTVDQRGRRGDKMDRAQALLPGEGEMRGWTVERGDTE